jgi:Zn-dependent peptidase ImmA (M78 family)/transcriptional regulator with XRE-family HTH domain
MISTEKLGERIALTRKRSGLTQAQLAEQIGVSRATLIAVEKGERRPEGRELVRLAEALNTTLNDLLREHAVVADVSPRFRSAAARNSDAATEAAVEQLRRLGARYTELELLLGIRRAPAPLEAITAFRPAAMSPGISPSVAGEDAARSVRTALGLGEGPAHRLESRLELEAGFRVFRLNLPPSLAAMLVWGDEIGACVALNSNHPPERQLYSLAHELGHFLRDREAGDLLPAILDVGRDPSEIFSDVLAKELLMPAAGVRRRFSEHLRDKGNRFSAADLVALAQFFEVSFQAMTLRLEELGLLPSGTHDRLTARKFSPREAEKQLGIERKTGRGIVGWLPDRYVRLALEAHALELLSEGELATFLSTDRLLARSLFNERSVEPSGEAGAVRLDLGVNVLGREERD